MEERGEEFVWWVGVRLGEVEEEGMEAVVGGVKMGFKRGVRRGEELMWGVGVGKEGMK